MAKPFAFPELHENMPDLPDDEEAGGDFSPLYQGKSGMLPSSASDDWRPSHVPASTRPGGAARPSPVGAPAKAEPAAPAAPAAGPAAATSAPRVDPRELERIRTQAREEGYREGFARGEQDARNAWLKRVEKVESLLRSLSEGREAVFHRVREDLVRIITLVPRKILRNAIQLEPQAVVSMVGAILEELPRQERLVVKVSPDDLRMLEEALPELKRRLGGYTAVELEPSPQVSSGGAVIVTEGGRIDATLERQLETFELRAREWILGAAKSSEQA